jgi:hypothetical protein
MERWEKMKLKNLIGETFKARSPDEQKFVDKHKIEVFDNMYAKSEYDHLFKGSKQKMIDRPAERHGYNPGGDEKVYEETEVDEGFRTSHASDLRDKWKSFGEWKKNKGKKSTPPRSRMKDYLEARKRSNAAEQKIKNPKKYGKYEPWMDEETIGEVAYDIRTGAKIPENVMDNEKEINIHHTGGKEKISTAMKKRRDAARGGNKKVIAKSGSRYDPAGYEEDPV